MRIELLDHGYIELVEPWGSDERIVEAARMSTGKGFLGWGPKEELFCIKCLSWVRLEDTYEGEGGGRGHNNCWGKCDETRQASGDEKLLRYLWEHKHATPFEMAGATFEVQAPIMVFREWHRHRTQSYNEMSARYIPLSDVNYVPTVERLMINAGTSNRQAGTVADAQPLTAAKAALYQKLWRDMYAEQQNLYECALRDGVPKELARVHLPVGRYSRMRASANLRNWLGFLTLRMDPAAQWEIRQYANALADMLEVKFPRTMELFKETRR